MSTTDPTDAAAAAAAAAAMPPASKRAKLLPTGGEPAGAPVAVVPSLLPSVDMRPVLQCLPLLFGATTGESGTQSADQSVPVVPLPASGPIGNNIDKMKELFDDHGFRTSLVTAPRKGLSIYLDSAGTSTSNANGAQEEQISPGKTFLSALLGLHPDQNEIEQWYSTTVREVYCLKLFCQHVRSALGGSSSYKDKVDKLLVALEDSIRGAVVVADAVSDEDAADFVSLGTDSPKAVASSLSATISNLQRLASSVSKTMLSLIPEISQAEHNLRLDQLQREYEGIRSHNSTYTNALMQLFLDAHRCTMKEIQLRRSHLPKYERIVIFLYDPNSDEMRPPKFTFLPSLSRIIDDGVEAVVDAMVSSFWNRLLRLGYFATSDLKNSISTELRQYFLMGLAKDTSFPFLLNANFTPRHPLSLYLHGNAGVGKSSFVRFFAPALEAVIEEFCDPEVACRFVKQNLNKKAQTLERELELRPNNNDLSVMSIIQGRRMTLSQRKPGLVVVGLEELASDETEADPNQTSTCQLISQRFSGRNSNYREGEDMARNSTKRGISGDSSLIVIFTSNYDLCNSAQEALKRLDMFQNLKVLKTTPLSGDDRQEFARTFIRHCVCDRLVGGEGKFGPSWDIDLKIPTGQGDIRVLVRELRALSLFVGKMLLEDVIHGATSSCSVAKITHDEKAGLTIIDAGGQTVRLRRGMLGSTFYPISDNGGLIPYHDSRADSTMKEFRRLSRQPGHSSAAFEVGHVLDHYYTGALAPAVVVSKDAKLMNDIVEALSLQSNVNVISGIDPDDYKMIRSLYDPVGSPNLRDDIMKFGRGSMVVVGLTCKSKNAQLLIREMIEDTPSRSAFSSDKSALEKVGLLFAVHVTDELTPEIRSRASIIL